MRPNLIRGTVLSTTVLLTLLAGYLFVRFIGEGGLTALDLMRAVLVVISFFWLAWGAAAALLGVMTPAAKQAKFGCKPVGLTAILVPIYNEDPVQTFSRIAAMSQGLCALGLDEHFHIAVLSDTTSPDVAAQEAVWFEKLLIESGNPTRIFYRRRALNIGKKAGNIEDFICCSGSAFDYALILDADSLMEAQTMVDMALQMDADSSLGLLQTVPKIIQARTLFGRSMQFSSNYLSPSFARGAALMQGCEGPYWGHNAIFRISAFAANCGLPVLSGRPPYGGHILSHDYVEAALLARAGWKVHVDPALEGSYEEGPENLIEYAKRDRRWCQGNLQHRRLLLAHGLLWWSRFTFLQGIMAYISAPLWLALLVTSVLAAMFPNQPAVLAGFGGSDLSSWALGAIVVTILVLPKILIFVRSALDGHNRAVGGNRVALLSVVGEIVFSTFLAPVLLLLQSRAVVQVLLGLDGGWPATSRSQGYLGVRDAFASTWWIVALGLCALGLTAALAPAILIWVVPTMLPAVLAPILVSLSSREYAGPRAKLFSSPQECAPTPVILQYRAILARWSAPVGDEVSIHAAV